MSPAFQPDGTREYASSEGNVQTPSGQTHFHTWEEDGSWDEPMQQFTTTTAIHLEMKDLPEEREAALSEEALDRGGSIRIRTNPFSDAPGTNNVRHSSSQHDNR